jgi:Protein of unknown function (DUF2807).
MKFNIYILFFLLLCTFTQCKKLGLQSPGLIIINERSTQSFTKICLFDNINLELTQGTIEKIQIEAGENIQSMITVDFVGDSVILKNKARSLITNPDQKIIARISVKKLNSISYQGSGNIICTNTITSPLFEVYSNTGAGNVYLNLNSHILNSGIYGENADFIFGGHADSCYTYCSSRGTIDYRNFMTDRLLIDYSSVRDAYVNVTNALYGNIFYVGNVYYKGHPAIVSVKERDKGRVISY